MHKLITEFIGTFFLVLIVGLAVKSGSDFAGLAIGLGLVALVFMGGHISGAHYNPAVTVAILVRKLISPAEAGGYIAAQILGGLCAGLVTCALVGSALQIAPGEGVTMVQLGLAEFLFTFMLGLVVLNVATSSDHSDNSFYGLAIGVTVTAAAYSIGGISGAALNPAVISGHNVIAGGLGDLPIYIAVQLVAGVLAGVAFKVTNPNEL